MSLKISNNAVRPREVLVNMDVVNFLVEEVCLNSCVLLFYVRFLRVGSHYQLT